MNDKNIKMPDEIIRQLLTPSEIRMLKNRYSILNQFQKGMTIRSIAETVQVGTDTVVRTIRLIESSGLKLNNNEIKQIKKSTPWIFGKTS